MIYVASRAKYGDMWKRLANPLGYSIGSSWIQESGIGETLDWPGLWIRCIREASECSALVLYNPDGADGGLKGALVEVGAALAHHRPVFYVGPSFASFEHHPLVHRCSSLDDALNRAEACCSGT